MSEKDNPGAKSSVRAKRKGTKKPMKGTKGSGRAKRKFSREPKENEWHPITELGNLVKDGMIGTIDEIFQRNYVIKEIQIYDRLLPDLKEEVAEIKMVQRQSAAGQISRFRCTVIVGNENGYIGVGASKNKEVGPGIRQAIAAAKINIIPVIRGCGSWECNCGGKHSIPYKVEGKTASVKVTLLPAPKGVGLACSKTARLVLNLAGIKDIWTKTSGNTRSAGNMAKAVVDALRNAYDMMVRNDN